MAKEKGVGILFAAKKPASDEVEAEDPMGEVDDDGAEDEALGAMFDALKADDRAAFTEAGRTLCGLVRG